MPDKDPPCRVPDTFVVRIAGLPVSALEGLRFERTWDLVQELLATCRWLTSEGVELADSLHAVIGEGRHPELKPQLVALRRAFYNRRRPSAKVWCPGLWQALPDDVVERAGLWLGELERHDALAARLPDVLATEQSAKQELVRAAVATDTFQYGLVQGSPVLSAELSKWLARQAVPSRKVVLRLVKYLARVVAKTSPYSTFTLSGLGGWSSVPNTWYWRSVAEPNVWLVQRMARSLAKRPELAETLPVLVNPSAVEEEGRLWFLDAAEGVSSTSMSEALRECLGAVDDQCSLADVRRGLLKRGASASVDRFLARLLDIGILEVWLPFRDQSDEHLGDLIGWLRAASQSPPLALEELHTLLTEYPTLTGSDVRREHHAAIHRIMTDLVDGPVPSKNLFHENAVLTQPVAGSVRWRPALCDLDVLRRFLAPFQPGLEAKQLASAAFAARFPADARVPLVRFYRALLDLARTDGALPGLPFSGEDLRTVLFDQKPDLVPRSALPGVREIARVRKEARTFLRMQPENPDGVVRIDPGVLAKMADSWPSFLRVPRSVSWYVQAVDDRLVLNSMGTGHGQGRTRVRRLLNQAGDRTCCETASNEGEGVLLAETPGVFGSNLNLRTPAVPFELDFPGVRSDADRRIPLSDLVVARDDSGRLRLLRDEAEVVPLHLGMMASVLLPRAVRFVLTVFGETPNPATGVWPLLVDFGGMAGTGVRPIPRVEVGRVTLVRASWQAPAGEVPAQHTGEADAAYLLRLVGWFHKHGIPERCFVRVLEPWTWKQAAWPAGSARKPMYLDLANWYLVALFNRSLKESERVVMFQEALPGLRDAPDYGEQGQRVTEYLVEVGGHA